MAVNCENFKIHDEIYSQNLAILQICILPKKLEYTPNW